MNALHLEDHLANPQPGDLPVHDAGRCVVRVPALNSYSTDGPSIMGRQSANEGFLRAWFRYAGLNEFYCLARGMEEARVFARVGERELGQGKAVYRWIAQSQIERIAEIGCAFLPGPQVADVAWLRRRRPRVDEADFSLVGMTHTTCELPIQDALANMLTAPVHPWDAQICPSVSVQTMVSQLLDDEEAWLRERLDARQVSRPELPVLPLGVHVKDFDPGPEATTAQRAARRGVWNMAANEVAVLYMGRLDLLTKANLFPLFDALELAARSLAARGPGAPRLVLVLAGWFNGDWNEKTIREGAAQAMPSVRVVYEDGRDRKVRTEAWHAADVFASLVDNVQETFGLTPLEAMAAALPVVVSDYDGYKESVRDGVDGFCIRTVQPPAGAAIDLVDRHADALEGYGQYVGSASWFVGIDIGQAAQAFEALALDPALRRRMGSAGRERARTYDWAQLIPRYQDLFRELALIRQVHRASGLTATLAWRDPDGLPRWGTRHPRHSDPFHSFAHYPSETLGDHTRVEAGALYPSARAAQERLAMLLERPIYRIGGGRSLDRKYLSLLLQQVEYGSRSVAELTHSLAPGAGLIGWARMQRQMAWLVKCGLLRVSAASEAAEPF